MTSMTYAPEVTSGKSVVLPFNSFARLQESEEKSYRKVQQLVKIGPIALDRSFRGSTHVGVRLIILTPIYFFFVVVFPVKK